MKVFDGTYRWKGNGRSGEWPSSCVLKVYKGPEVDMVVVEDIPGPEGGTSITNCVEFLATKIVAEFSLRTEDMLWIEHYPHSGHDATYDSVEFEWVRGQATSPRWFSLPKQYVDLVQERAK